MPSSDINWPTPLTRLNPWYPGQMGVPGTDNETGLRMNSTGAVFYVDPNYPGASDARDGTNPTDPLLTIAAALTKCQPYRGDVIAVMANNAWQYHNTADGYLAGITGPVVVTVPGVRIVGVNLSGSLGVTWMPTADNQTLITVEALDVLIEGFNFYQGPVFTGIRAIFADWGTLKYGDNLTVRHNHFENIPTGIQLEYAWYCHLHHNFFEGGGAGNGAIYVDTAGSGSAYNMIHDNIFNYCNKAMSIQDMDYSFIFHNSLYDWRAATGAAATDAGIDLAGGLHNQVYDNFFSCLLPVPAVGDWNDYNTAGTNDAWTNNHCMNGDAVTNPT
jgi:hypothetical protein